MPSTLCIEFLQKEPSMVVTVILTLMGADNDLKSCPKIELSFWLDKSIPKFQNSIGSKVVPRYVITCHNITQVFHKHTTLAIMPILASEALLHKFWFQVQHSPFWASEACAT